MAEAILQGVLEIQVSFCQPSFCVTQSSIRRAYRREEWRLWYAGHPLSQDEFFSKLGGFCYSIFNDPSDGTRWFQIEQYERFLIAWHAAEPNLEAKRQVYEMQIAKKREIADVSPYPVKN